MHDADKELLVRALSEIRRLKGENAALVKRRREPVAVVGCSCRFPGECPDPESFWKFLEEGRCAIHPMPEDRAAGAKGNFGSYLDDVDLFDAAFFGIAPREAQALDPQQRLLLELVWHACESANIRPENLAGRPVGVFVGISGFDYALKLFSRENLGNVNAYYGTGIALSPAAGRLSYFLKITGPSMAVDTACSSSLVALHLAVESLRRGECEMAFVAGVNRLLGPELTINFERMGLMSADGLCRAFDADSHGYSRGEGGGMLVLKRQSDAEAAGDAIRALILGSAVNQDGGSAGLTVPSGLAQQKVVREALESAGIAPSDVDYVEAHGTGTLVGDPIEANSLAEVFAPGRDPERPLLVGSVKTNFGHLEAAAGMASCIKVIEALRHEKIVPQIHFGRLNPKIDWNDASLKIASEAHAWPHGERRRIAGVSGFGFAGTNAHVIFAEAPVSKPNPAVTEPRGTANELLVLSARSVEALRQSAARLAARLTDAGDGDQHEEWPSIAHTARVGRAALPERLGLVAASAKDAAALLAQYAEKGKARGMFAGRVGEKTRAAFVFTGQGAHYSGMGRGLYESRALYREIVDACAEKLKPLIGRDLREILFGTRTATATAPAQTQGQGGGNVFEALRNNEEQTELDDIVYGQLGLFVTEYALARLWESWGLRPSVVLGHSIGEYAAACFAGVLSLDDALKLVAERGRLMATRSPAGAMLTVFAEEQEILPLIQPHADTLSIAAVNGPGILLVSGAPEAAAQLEKELEARGVRSVRMRLSRAYHSPLTEPVLKEFEAVAATLTLHRPKIPLISNLTGGFVDEEIAKPGYWSRHMRQSVRFCESMTLLHSQKIDVLVEVGPEPTLMGLDLCFRQVREKAASNAQWVTSLRRGHDDVKSLLESAGRVWTWGAAIDLRDAAGGDNFPMTALPLYPYQRKRHWYDMSEPGHLETEAVQSAAASPSPAKSAPVVMRSEGNGQPPGANVSKQKEATKTMETKKRDYLAEVQAILCSVSGLEPADLHRGANLLEMGLDSLMFVRSGRMLEKRFQVKIPVKRFYEDLHRVGPLVDFLEEHAGAGADAETDEVSGAATIDGVAKTDRGGNAEGGAVIPTRAPLSTPTEGSFTSGVSAMTGLDPVMQAHFRLMERYLEIQGRGGPLTEASASCATPADSLAREVEQRRPGDNGAKQSKREGRAVTGASMSDGKMTRNFAGFNLEEEKGLTEKQRAFLCAMAERYAARTKGSKETVQAWRRQLADWKGSIQFKRSLKEVKYSIVSDRAEGSRIWDIDGNEYIDIAGGMGVHFLGHGLSCIKDAMHRQIERSLALGPQSDLAGEVARKICLLTGAERACLAITGSGAVMQAQRIARAATGRPLIAQFGGSYHGIGSEVLVAMGEEGPIPISAGIPASVVENTPLLDYGSEEALEWIRENASQLAAVIVEPVQSRRPGYQPHRFLRRLRKLTEELDIALIFDEMINGFRIHPGGAQAWFGIKADIITYGKIVGGGMPLAVVAGKARYLDWVDGGFWTFGDDSTPNGKTVFTGGTHNRHPLALAAANAALDYMIEQGPALQERASRLTERLVKELNAFFEAESVAFRVNYFGSQFRFEALRDAFELEVFFHLLTEQGIYTWEQRTCCLSIAHTDEDVDRIIEASRRVVAQMREGGFEVRTGTAAPRRVLPMTPVQERLFALCQRDGAETPYHLSGVWEMRGRVDAFRLQDAYQEVVRRHESLRTAFGIIGGKPCQYIIEEPRVFLERVEAEGRSPEALLEAFVRPFDLERPPLLRLGWVPLGEDRALLLADAHHIAVDGLSMNVVVSEFAELYDGRRLAPVKRQYRHATEEMERFRATPEYRAQESYWLERLSGHLPVLDLPTDFARSGRTDFRGARHLLTIEPERTKRLEAYARERGASLYMVLLSAFSALLGRLAEANDLIVGLPVGGRPGADSDDVVGMFVNSLALRTRPQPGKTFGEFLAEVREACLSAYDNSEYDFGELVDKLRLERNPDRSPVFDVMFAYESADNRIMRTQDLEIRTLAQYQGSGMFDFNADIIREAGTLNIHLHYATRLLRASTVARWADLFSRLLDAIAEKPDFRLGSLQLFSPEALEEAVVRFNAAGPDRFPRTTLTALWRRSAERFSEGIALVCGERRLSYRELDDSATAIARHLIGSIGVRRGDRVALLLDSRETMLLAILGVLKAGGCYVPIDPENPAERVRAVVQDSGARVVIVDSAAPWSVLAGSAMLSEVRLLMASGRSASAEAALPELTPEEAAYVIYTSGSTGQPKGVVVEHGGIANSVQWRSSALNFSEREVTLQLPTYAFDASLLDIFPTLAAGGRLVLVPAAEKRDLGGQAGLLREAGVTNLLMTPSLHALYLQEIASSMTGLRLITVAGEAMPLAQVKLHFERLPHVRLFNEYGPTENSVVTTWTELRADDDSVSIGVPVAGNSVYVLDSDNHLCGVGMAGELVVAGPGLARGYLNRPELTAAAFVQAPWDPKLRIYRTGDRARWRADGKLDYLGRRDGQVKLRGNRIELEEIEAQMARQQGVKAAATKVAPLNGEAQLIGYVVARDDFDEELLKAALRAKLPSYMVPSVIVRLGSIPINGNGKVDRRALPVPSEGVSGKRSEPPKDSREELVASVWRDVLRVETIGRQDDYFRLGGDSIKGIQIISRLLRQGWRVEMQQLFNHPSVAGLAAQLQPARAAAAEIGADARADFGVVPLGGIQSWFFDVFGTRPVPFNQAVWLKARGRLSVDALRNAIECIVAHHGAFRYRYSRTDGKWTQSVASGAPKSACVSVRVFDLRGRNAQGQDLDALVVEEQKGVDIERGPLTRVVLVRTDAEDRLLWVVHHLVVDGVSWRILMEDLDSAYGRLRDGKHVELQPTTASFGRWVKAMQDLSLERSGEKEAAYWRRVMEGGLPTLPSKPSRERGTVKFARSLERVLSGASGSRIVGAAHAAFRTRGAELLVAALRAAYAKWNPGAALYLLMEGHGREALSADAPDVSRTVGWFTAHYPVRFAQAVEDRGSLIRETKEVLRSIPSHGAGFVWLAQQEQHAALRTAALPEIGFNYLGDLDGAGDRQTACFDLCVEQPEHCQESEQPLTQAIEIVAHLSAGSLRLRLTYDSGRFEEAGMRAFLDAFEASIAEVAETAADLHTRVPEGIPSPSDFEHCSLGLAAFDRMVVRLECAPDEIEEIYPLTPMQKGLHYEALRSPDSDAYFEQASFRLDQVRSTEAFTESWRDVVRRHRALRSIFVHPEGAEEAVQVVLRGAKPEIVVEDLRGIQASQQEEIVRQRRLQDRSIPFGLDEAPPHRLTLLRIGETMVEVILSNHHILMDGWCIGLLYEDLMRCYEARVVGRQLQLEPAADYGTYLRWLRTTDRAAARQYWRDTLTGYDTLATVPADRTPGAGDYRCAKTLWRLEGEDWERLRATAASCGATTATLLQTLWAILLARYNGSNDVVFGTVVSGRPETLPDAERMMGLFVNSVPVRMRFDGVSSVAEALRRFQTEAIARRKHEHLSLAEIGEEAGGLRSLFDHLVVLENYPMEDELRGRGGEGVAGRPKLISVVSYERTHLPLTLVAVPHGEALEVEVTYNEAVYTATQIERMRLHLTTLVEQAAAKPTETCLSLDWLPAAEKNLLERWNATKADYPEEATLASLFQEQVAAHPKRSAANDGAGGRLTYRELDQRARKLAAKLADAGVRRGDRVAIWLPREVDMIVALLGTLMTGGCYVPLDPEYPEERLRFILEDCGASVLVARGDHRSPFPGLREVLVDEACAGKASAPRSLPSAPEPGDAAYIIYTSGSTGKPKGCLISHRNVVRLMRNDRFDFKFGPEDVWIVAHSFCFDFSVWEMYGALLNGGRVVVAPREIVRDTRRFAALVASERVTVLNQTPAAFYAFSEEALKGGHDYAAHLHTVIFGGDRLEPRYLKSWSERFSADRIALVNMYGITETTVHVTYHRVTDAEIRDASGRSLVGRPLPETEVWVMDEQLRPLPIGVTGELYVGGSGVGLGYLNRPELTAERFLPDPRGEGRRLYRSGDVGRWREDGVLEYQGRNDHQVQVRGFRVELGEVESALLRQPGIRKAVVVPFEQEAGQLELAAYLVGESRPASELRNALETLLPVYMVPGYIEWLDAIPLTANGKTDRKALPKPGSKAGISRSGASERPLTECERTLQGLWKEVLGVETIGLNDNFFDLGGQSLKAVRLRARIEDVFHLETPLKDIFGHPTIEAMAGWLTTLPQAASGQLDDDLATIIDGVTPEELEAQLRKLEQ